MPQSHRCRSSREAAADSGTITLSSAVSMAVLGGNRPKPWLVRSDLTDSFVRIFQCFFFLGRFSRNCKVHIPQLQTCVKFVAGLCHANNCRSVMLSAKDIKDNMSSFEEEIRVEGAIEHML